MARLKAASSLDPVCRLLCLVLFSSASLVMVPVLACIFIALLLILIYGEGIAPARIAREALFIVGLVSFTFVLQGVSVHPSLRLDPAGMLDAGAFGLRLVAAYLSGRLFYGSTRNSELRDAGTRICRCLPGGRDRDLGLVLALVLSFIPLIVDEWNRSLEAARARGLPRHPRLDASAMLLASFLRRLMLRAVAVPEALAARGWSGARMIENRKWGIRELVASASSLGLLCLSLATRPV